MKYTFASDNCAGVDKRLMKAIENANTDFCLSYGDDKYTDEAVDAFKKYSVKILKFTLSITVQVRTL